MRRLLAVLVTCGLLLGPAASALAAGRVPAGVSRISVTLTFPRPLSGSHRTVRRTLTRGDTVATVVHAIDALPAAPRRHVCPMLVRLGPELTVVLRNSRGAALADVHVAVTTGTRGASGASTCFPIFFATAAGKSQSLLGNSFVRMMGRLIGTKIS